MSTAIILMNLGTPVQPTVPAVRSFLRDFLSDPRVVEIPRPLWLAILNGFILPFRPKRIAPAYEEIWNCSADGAQVEGSPLLYYTRGQAELLQRHLRDKGGDLTVEYAMTYGEPHLNGVIDSLRDKGYESFMFFRCIPSIPRRRRLLFMTK